MGEHRSRNTNHKANNVGYSCKQKLHRTALINTDEPVWAEQCKIFSAQVKGRQHDLARFSLAAHMGYLRISISKDRLIHTLHTHHTSGNIFRLLLCKLCEWLHHSLPDYMIKYKSDKAQCTEPEHWSSNNPLISPSKSNFNSILCPDRCSSLTEFDGNLQ